MTTMTIFLILLAATVLHVALTLYGMRRHRRRDELLHRIDAVLELWAETWGDPPERVRERLLEIYPKAGSQHRRASDVRSPQ